MLKIDGTFQCQNLKKKMLFIQEELKQMSGGDKMTSKGLFKETKDLNHNLKLRHMCNDLPKLAGNDGGIWRRIEVVNYIAKFSDNPRPCETDLINLADEKLNHQN